MASRNITAHVVSFTETIRYEVIIYGDNERMSIEKAYQVARDPERLKLITEVTVDQSPVTVEALNFNDSESQAIFVANNSKRLRNELERHVQLANSDVRNREYDYDFSKSSLISKDGKYRVQWKLRRNPSRRISKSNPQTIRGVIDVILQDEGEAL